ncbi:hypothetical protein RI367_001486 [Sorochytrium milnesiophthora]
MKYTVAFCLVLAVLLVSSSSATPVQHQQRLERRRFGQEHPAVIQELADLGNLPSVSTKRVFGQFQALAGGTISALLAASNPCDLLDRGDQFVNLAKQLDPQDTAKALPVIQKLLHSEKNFNPFSNNPRPSFCADPAKPANKEIRCILPLVDPSSGGAGKQGGGIDAAQANQKTDAILAQVQAGAISANHCAGQSIQQQMQALGFTDCVGCTASSGSGSSSGNNSNAGSNASTTTTVAPPAGTCPPASTVTVTVTVSPSQATQQPTAAPSGKGGNLNTFSGALFGVPVTPLTLSGDPTRKFEVQGETFVGFGAACNRSCGRQHNGCAAKANAPGGGGGAAVGQCDQQEGQCNQACTAALANVQA